MKSLAILTSGGDNAGLNAAIRSFTRTCISRGIRPYGVYSGYRGLVNGQIEPLTTRTVSGTMGLGGTFLGTARLPEWREAKVRREAIRHLNRREIEGLVVCGGNGSLAGATQLHKDGFPVIGIPCSIDDDVFGTDVCLGVDTALNVIIDAIDRIRDCASSIQRAFIVEVMGRDCGSLALMAASATGAEVCLVPEIPSPSMDSIADTITDAYTKGKPHCIVVVAEGWKPGTNALVKFLNDKRDATGFDVRTTVLGYTQRGGSPSYIDRYYATLFGSAAVDAISNGVSGKMIGIKNGSIAKIDLEQVVGKLKPISQDLYKLYQQLDN